MGSGPLFLLLFSLYSFFCFCFFFWSCLLPYYILLLAPRLISPFPQSPTYSTIPAGAEKH